MEVTAVAHENLLLTFCEFDSSGALPEWIHITPATYVVAKDGRHFDFSDAAKVIAASKLPLLLDVDHLADMGGSTAAAGWLMALELSDGSARAQGIWAKCEWTAYGAELVQTKVYRYLSPTFYQDPETLKVLELVGTALTNRPALSLTPLDAQRMAARYQAPLPKETPPMDEHVQALCAALQVDPAAEANHIELAAKSATQLREQCTQLTTELAAANDRAVAAEKKVADMESSAFLASVDACLDEACKDGKVTPAQKDAYRVFCSKSPEDFELFKQKLLPTLKPAVERAPSSPELTSVDPNLQKTTGLTPDRIKAAQQYNAQHSGAAVKE